MSTSHDDRRLNVYSLVTPSHETLLNEWFLRTLPPDCRPFLHFVDAEPVAFGQDHWHRVVVHKFDVLRRALATEPAGAVIVMSDVDIRFYRPFAADVRRRIAGLDVLFQANRPVAPRLPHDLCTGFMVIRCGVPASAFFERAHALLVEADDPLVGDQAACIRALVENPAAIRYDLLPSTYWVPDRPSIRTPKRWQPGSPLDPPRDIVLHHANYTDGTEVKLAQLGEVECRLLAAPCEVGVPEPPSAAAQDSGL
jgi:hypothetical protein